MKVLEGYRLSPQQKRLWLLGGPSARTLLTCSILIEGPLDLTLLGLALDRLVERHEILRTGFEHLPGMDAPVQVVADGRRGRPVVIDLRAVNDTGAEQAEVARQCATAASGAEGGLERAVLVRRGGGRHELLLGLSALCADVRSVENIIRELAALYGAGDGDAATPGEVIQYADFSEWQNELLESDDVEEARQYWSEQRGKLPEPPALPRESAPDGDGGTGRTLSWTLADDGASPLRSLAEREGTSVEAVLLACWQALLWLLTGRPEVVVETSFDGRKFEYLRDALGPFAKYIPVSSRIEEGFNFGDLLRQLTTALKVAHKRQEYCSHDLLYDSAPPPGVGFSYWRWPQSAHAGPLTLSLAGLGGGADGCKLRLECLERETGLLFHLHYDERRYGGPEMERLQEQYGQLLAGVAAAPREPLRRLALPGEGGWRPRPEEETRAGAGLQTPPLIRAERGAEVALSFAQRRLWFIDQLEPGSALYNIPMALRLSGELKKEALGRTLSEIVRRHEVLRTTFKTVAGEPLQIIHPPQPVKIALVELNGLEDEGRATELQRLMTEEASAPFDLSHDLLLRVRLVRTGESEHVVLLTMHHIVSDGWSMGVLTGEVATLYRAYSEGQESPLPELEVQYADFALWQRQWLRGEALERQLGYWDERLRGAATLELPTDRPRPIATSYRGGRHPFLPGQELTQRLQELSRREGATLFMTLLAGFQTLLSRYTGQTDIVVGTDIANRNRKEVEPLIGFFVNQLVLRGEVAGESSFRGLLARVREACLGAYAHQDVPFEKLVEELHPERDLGRSPLFQVKLVLQNAPVGELELPGLTLSEVGGAGATARFDLLLMLTETGQGLTGWWSYSTDLFDAETVERMSGHLVTLLAGAVEEPGWPVAELPLLTEAEREQLERWNQTRQDYPLDECVHQLFEAQAARTPDAVAVVFGDDSLSYRELNARANQLAHYLETSASARRWSSGSASSGASRWSWGCSASSRPGVPTCRSTPPTRWSASPSCWRTRAWRCC